jgi:hypothetical protein
MQNIDFYEGKNLRNNPSQFERIDPEFYPRMTEYNSRSNDFGPREEEKHRKKANRMMFVIISLCIISFTAGLVIGIKFAGGSERKIVDDKTIQAVSGLSNKVTGLMNNKDVNSAKTADDSHNIKQKENVFPKEDYPFIIKVGSDYDKAESQKIAGFLSSKGHTVILSKTSKDTFKIYIGPFKNQLDAKSSLNKFSGYNEFSIASNSRIVKRI